MKRPQIKFHADPLSNSRVIRSESVKIHRHDKISCSRDFSV